MDLSRQLTTKRRRGRRPIMMIGGLSPRQLVFGAFVITLVVFLINPFAEQAEGKKFKKEKKVLKSLVKGLILKNLSTKKNFLPLPVPIPVPIELSEPPVYLKGQPKYVTVYKQAPPVVKPTTVYHMPVYSPRTYEYMMSPMGMYGSMMMPDDMSVYNSAHGYHGQTGLTGSSAGSKQATGNGGYESQLNSIKFNDFDDEFGNYYLRKSTNPSGAATTNNMFNLPFGQINNRADPESIVSNSIETTSTQDDSNAVRPKDELESLDSDEHSAHKRVKRQVYHQSSYENEPPCDGFPLEINIKSRIKMDQLFPIQGNSQYKKCIKVGRPLLPPVEEDHRPY